MRAVLWLMPCVLWAQTLRVGEFAQEVRTVNELADVRSVAITREGTVWTAGPGGLRSFAAGKSTAFGGVTSAELVAAGDDAVWFTSRGALWRIRAAAAERVAGLPAAPLHLAAGKQVL